MKECVCIFILYISFTGFTTSLDSCNSDCYRWYGGLYWSAWTSWGSCSRTCGGGSQTRYKYCRYSSGTYTTRFCTTEQCCNRVCYNGGTWVDTDPSTCTGECRCQDGYIGDCCQQACPTIEHCETGQVECNFLSSRCNKCTPPYISTGWSATCRKPICNPSCKNNGTCISDDVCNCKSGYIGQTCELGGNIDSFLLPTLAAVETRPFKPLSWFDKPGFSEFERICYAKIGMKNAPTETLVTAESLTSRNESFGTFTTGPLDHSGGLKGTSRVACVQIRCPSNANYAKYRNINVKVHPKTSTGQCLIGSVNMLLNATIDRNTTTHDVLQFDVEYGVNYGPTYGIYIGIGTRDKAIFTTRQQCLSGANFNVNTINTNDGLLATYNC